MCRTDGSRFPQDACSFPQDIATALSWLFVWMLCQTKHAKPLYRVASASCVVARRNHPPLPPPVTGTSQDSLFCQSIFFCVCVPVDDESRTPPVTLHFSRKVGQYPRSSDCYKYALLSTNSGFRCGANEIFDLLGCYVAYIGSYVTVVSGNLSVPSSRVKQSKKDAGNT